MDVCVFHCVGVASWMHYLIMSLVHLAVLFLACEDPPIKKVLILRFSKRATVDMYVTSLNVVVALVSEFLCHFFIHWTFLSQVLQFILLNHCN